jgi:hypothetical protein
MRTTLDLPDPLFRQLKAYAAARGLKLKDVLQRAVENELAGRKRGGPARRVKAPILPSKQPGVLNLTNAKIDELLA